MPELASNTCDLCQGTVVSFLCTIEQVVRFDHGINAYNPVEFSNTEKLLKLFQERAMILPFTANETTCTESNVQVMKEIKQYLILML